MSNIPTSSVVEVDIAVGATFPPRFGFGVACLVTKEAGNIGRAERIREYLNIDGVTEDWPGDSEVVAAATAYYSQQPKPLVFKVAMRYEDDQPAELRGGSVADTPENLALFTAITDGSFAITIDGDAQDITALDFSSETTMAGVATVIETALQAVATGGYTLATCTYKDNRFRIDPGVAGSASTISFLTPVDPAAGTDISSLLQMQQGEGTTIQGIDGETITESLDAIENVNSAWYGFGFTKEVRDGVQVNAEDAVQAAAAWAQARVKVFATTSNDLDSYDSVSTADIGYILSNAGYDRTITTFCSKPDLYPEFSVLGRAFTVNFSQPDSTITLKFKQLPGITPEDLTQNQKAVLDTKRINAYIVVGSSPMYAESYMASAGQNRFFDEVHGIDWLTNAIQTNVFGYTLTRTTKVLYTDKGVAAEEQQVIKALDEAVFNGFIAPGTTIEGEFLPLGYKTVTVPVALVNQSDKEARQYNGLSFTVIGAGALHGLQINGTFVR
jgi:hypothetical protein